MIGYYSRFLLLKIACISENINSGGKIAWKELINLKKDKEAKFMVSVKEWAQKVAEMFLKDAETEAEKNCLLNLRFFKPREALC